MNLPYDPYFTHCPVLTKCILNTTGPILELGTGVYSSTFISFLAGKRKIISLDTDLTWLKGIENEFKTQTHNFLPIVCDNDDVKYNLEMDKFKLSNNDQYSLVFIDHGLIKERKNDILRFRDIADIIIVHDSSFTLNQGHDDITYNYNPIIKTFKYIYEYTKLWPFTCVMSDINDLSWLNNL